MRRARERIRDYLREQRVAEEAVHAVVLAIEEAMTNAVRHSGTGEDLEVDLRFEGADLVTEVRDHGRGFDTARFDPARRPDPAASGGRGLFLMARMMDDLAIECDGGVEIRGVKRGVLSEPPTAEPSIWRLPCDLYAEGRGAALLDELDEAFAALDWEYRLLYVNRACERHLGRTRDELVGRSLWQAFPGTVDDPTASFYREAMELGRAAVVEYEPPIVGGWVEARIYPAASGITVYLREIDERKRKELERDELFAALHESEDRYRRLFENLTSAFVLAEPIRDAEGRLVDLRYLLANSAVEKHLKVVADEMVGRTYSEVFRYDQPNAFFATYEEVLSTGEPYSGEAFLPALGRHYDMTVYRPRPDQLALVLSDVTERKQAEEALRASEEVKRYLAEVIETADVAFAARRPDGTLVSFNRAFTELTGYTRSELEAGAESWAPDMTPPDWWKAEAPLLARAVATRNPTRYEKEYVRKDGSRVPVEVFTQPLFDERGELVQYRSFLTEISERKAAETERQRLLEELSVAIDQLGFLGEIVEHHSMPFGVGAPDGGLIFFNQAFADLTGYSRDELEARRLTWASDLTPPEWRETEARLLAAAVAERRSARYEKEYLRKDGTRVPVELFVQPVFDDAGALLHYRSFLTDITDRKRTEEALRTAEEIARASEARYRSVVELATRTLALDADLDIAKAAEEATDPAAKTAKASATRRRLRLVEAILAQRRHRVQTVLIALAFELAFLVPMGLSPTRGILGMPGSLLALTVIVVAAIAGTWSGVATALAGTAIFYFTVAGSGASASPLAIAASAGIWVAAAVLSSLVTNTLIEQSERRRQAAIAFVEAETARRAQSRELHDARRIATVLQESFIHALPPMPGWELGAATAWARALERAGGDFHDVFVTQRDHMGVLIGDVEGKGLEAAGLTETVRSAAHALAISAEVPDVLCRLNDILLRRDDPLVTALLASVHCRTGDFVFASAGHPLPLSLRADGSIQALQAVPGLPGSFSESRFATATGSLGHGDALLFYTDGVTDARRAGRFFGEEGLLEAAKGCAGLTAQETADRVLQTVTAYADELRDDLHVLVVQRA
jgi:PAS domain S-box-containing protein